MTRHTDRGTITKVPSSFLTQPLQSSKRVAIISMLVIIGLAFSGLAFTIAALEIQSAARAYIAAEGHWSKGQQEAVYALTRYARTGEEHYYRQAMDALAIPLGDHRARLALNEDPPDLETARKGFMAGNNHPADIDDLIWLYKYFSSAPYFEKAIDLWREGDQFILEIRHIAERLHAELNQPAPSAAVIDESLQELGRLDSQVRPIEAEFSNTLGEGVRWLKDILLFLSFLVLAIVTGGVAFIFIWATRRIATSESKFRATFHHAAVGMVQMTPDEAFNDVNETLCNILGYSRDEMLGMTLIDVTYPQDRGADADDFRMLMNNEIENYTVEKRLVHSSGTPVWCKLTLSRVGEFLDLPRYLIGVIEDISEARRLSTKLSHQATHDSLTGTINRAEFERRLRETIRNAHIEQEKHTLCFVDLDQFKIINDTCGHSAGDELLKQVTQVLHQNLRRGDTLARLGGDEFGIIFSDCDIDSAREVADKLRNALYEFFFAWRGATFNISASMGLVEINEYSAEAGSLLKEADTACYAAKDHGRNQLHVYNESDLVVATRRNEMEWVSRIREALAEDRLHMYAQHIQPMHGAAGPCYEVLVRLLDTDGQTIEPGVFLPAAERYNVATLIDRWVLRETLATISKHSDHLHQLDACHINLSAQSISRQDFHQFVHEMLDEYAVPPDRICLEITETAAVSNMVEARKFIDSIGQRGCRFALDDFGSGLSSFGYLRSLPVDIIKIDGSFVRSIDEDDIHFAMVRSITEIVHLMGKIVVAEFAENNEILGKLREIGVDYAQGYAIHRPCPLRDLLTGRDRPADKASQH
ncbi:MAG: EAL domain-containing protein [Gammaproteobacteria bacterium]|nr:EAL domain-containing protein [Gammaproteobacteria bacterium]